MDTEITKAYELYTALMNKPYLHEPLTRGEVRIKSAIGTMLRTRAALLEKAFRAELEKEDAATPNPSTPTGAGEEG